MKERKREEEKYGRMYTCSNYRGRIKGGKKEKENR